MSSTQNSSDWLREQAYKTLTPQIQGLEEELQKVGGLLSEGIRKIGYKLEALRHTELPATEPILDEFLQEALRKRDLDNSGLALFTRELRLKETQEEILSLLLDKAVQYFPRVALFSVKDDRFFGWSSRGFSEAVAAKISSNSFARFDCPQFLKALENDDPLPIDDLSGGESLRLMCENTQGPWRLFPLFVLQRPVAILAAGETGGYAGRPEAVTILMSCSALRLENIALKILNILNAEKSQPAKVPTPAPFPVSIQAPIVEPAFVAPAAPVFSEPVFAEPVTVKTDELIPAPTPLVFHEDLNEPVQETVSSFAEPFIKTTSFTTPPPPVFFAETPAPIQMSAPAPIQMSAPAPIPMSAPAPIQMSAPAPVPMSAPAPMPMPAPTVEKKFVYQSDPAPQKPVAPQSAQPVAPSQMPEEEKAFAEAKRFARLLVTEIKLYNEQVVNEGRRNHDLYLRLKKDIDKSRDMYEKRIAPNVSRKIDCFHDEIVRVLGDNDASSLGRDYPGSKIGT